MHEAIYLLWNTIWGVGEKLAPCQINHLNNHCYKIWKFNHCNYFTSVNQGIQKLENLSNSRARTSARERCSYRYWAAWSPRVTGRQAPQEGPTRPFPWGRPKGKGAFKSCFFQKWKKGLMPSLFSISPTSAVSSVTDGLGTKGRCEYRSLKQGTCVSRAVVSPCLEASPQRSTCTEEYQSGRNLGGSPRNHYTVSVLLGALLQHIPLLPKTLFMRTAISNS